MRWTATSLAFCALALAWLLLAAQTAMGQTVVLEEAADRPVSSIRIEGLKLVDEQLVRNQIRTAVGDPLDAQTVRGDVRLLSRLGRFASIDAVVELQADGTVALIYRVVEQPIIAEVQTVGNKLISDQELLAAVRVTKNVPRDDFLIQNSIHAIEELYRKRGHYLVNVSVDESQLTENGILLFRVIEGPRVRIKAIEYEGNHAFSADQLKSKVSTETWIPLLRKGELDEERLIDDVASLDKFYKERGYLDVRVDRKIDLSPDESEAKVIFVIDEGKLYRLRSVQAQRPGGQPLRVFAEEQVAALLEIRPGDVYSQDKLRKSFQLVRDAYAVMSYLGEPRGGQADWIVDIKTFENRIPEQALVDLVLEIDEGKPYKVGPIEISGNFLTKDKVIRRRIGLKPGLPFDGTEIEKSRRRIERTRLFNDVRITVQDPEPDEPEYRDVLVEVKEKNTGSFNFGVAVGSDSGVFGELSLRQDNFDIADWPESFDELIHGRAFRGAGQQFVASIRPGNEVSQYQISLTEPHIFETDTSLRGTAFLRERIFDDYDEERLNFSTGLMRRLGEIWEIGLNARVERVELTNIDDSAPVDVFEDAGPDMLTALSLNLTRTTIGTINRPGKGSRLEFSLEQVGIFGGDFTFTTLNGEYTGFFTLDEDFFGRKTTFKLSSRASYIFNGDEAPIYERLYLGGRSFRGFEFRTISPKGIRADNGLVGNDPVGGQWLFFLGGEYEIPIFENVITGVLFCDSGTVTNDIGFDEYRVSVGFGIRLYIPQLGPVPISFDFGIPILSESGDEEQVLNFGAQLPFN